MARKRMFDNEIISQDTFIDLAMEPKALYFLLGMEADDEGFVNYKKVLRLYGGTEDSIRILAQKQFIIPFLSGVIVITDWRRNNYLSKNRIKETIYQNEKKQLIFNETTEKYELIQNPCNTSVKQMLNKCLTRIDENRVEENSIEENSVDDDIERPDNKTSSASAPINNLQEQEYQTPELLDSGNQERYESETPELPKKEITIFEYLETNFGRTISPREYEIINSYQDSFSLEVIKEAIDRACINNAKTIRYVMGILNSWKAKGFKKVEECQSEFNEIRKRNKYNNTRVAPEPEWIDKEIKKKNTTDLERKQMEELLSEYK